MLSLTKLMKHKRSTSSPFLSRLYTSSLCSPQRHHTPSRRNPNTAYYDDVVAQVGQAGDLTRLRQLLIERINKNCFNSNDTFNFITNTHSSISTLDSIFGMLASLPAGIPRRNAFESFVKRLCIIGLLDHALQVLGKMHQRNLERNSFTCYPVIKTLIKKGDVTDDALNVLKEVRKYGIVPDTTSYNYLLTTYCLRKEVGNAVDVLAAMMEEDVRGDSRTYDAMVLGACKVGKVEGAVAIVRAAVDNGVTLLHCTHAHVIKALLKAGYFEQGLKFVLCFAGQLKRLDDMSFGVLVDGLIELRRFEETKLVVDEMTKRRLFVREHVEEFCLLHGIK